MSDSGKKQENDIAQYIRKCLSQHFDEHRIRADKKTIDEMVAEALGGKLAFNIIYSDVRHSHFEYRLEKYKTLDHRKLVHSNERNQTIVNVMPWSYDSGYRFQWDESETIRLDASAIREMKLSQIIEQQ